MSSLKERIQAGRDGKYKGLDNGLGDINKYIYDIQRGTYYLVGALSGAGKTTLVDYMLLTALEDAKKKGQHVEVFYYSFEIKEEIKKLNWLSVHIFKKYGIIISPQAIGGLGEEILSDAQKDLVDSEIDYVEELFNSIHFRFEPTNPTGIFHELMEFAGNNGKFIKERYESEDGTKERIVSYTPTEEDSYVLVALDHQSLAKRERNYSLKENIDKLSEYFVYLRNICNYSFFMVSQFNQSLNSIDRMKFKGVDLSPQQNDFKDSTNPYQDADIVLGIMNPWKMDFKQYLGYDLSILKEKVRVVKIIKNRVGRDNVAFAYVFNPLAGNFKCLPPARDIEILGGYEQYLI